MKSIIILIAIMLVPLELFSQNINGKLGLNGQFIIRDTNSTFLTVDQNSGYLTINTNLRLQNSTSPTIGNIFKEGNIRFIHNYGTDNTFVGLRSGSFSQTTAAGNTGIGSNNLTNLQSGNYNTGVGANTLSFTISGFENTAVGYQSLYANNTGKINTAIGVNALYTNYSGSNNTCLGHSTLFSNSVGNNNTAVGYNTLYATTGNNNTALGYNASVPNSSGDNQVRIGNTFVNYAGVQVAWTITSDRKWKDNITKSNLGLGFITKLNPVSYIRKNDIYKKVEYGFIAQELDDVLKESGVENTGMITIDDNGNYEFRYNDLFAPIVKAIQELKSENDELKSANEKLTLEMQSLKTINEKLVKLEKIVNELSDLKHAALEVSK
ncbi:MAG: tail fiber domain-containing protein [Ignavibacteria bacterium]|nr:tail fiber domain-containing protein [Ignavibacteria bacterium]